MGAKGMLSCLTALLLLFSQGVLQGTKAEDNKIITKINLNRGLEYEYQPLDMKTLFNMGEERSNKSIAPLDTRFITFMFSDYTVFTIPCRARMVNLVKDTEKSAENLTNQQMFLSTLKGLVDDKSYNNLKNIEWICLYMNLADDSVVASSIDYEEEFFINRKYIDKNFGNDKNLIDYEFSFLANQVYFAAINEKLSQEERATVMAELDIPITLDEYRENYYKRIVSIYEWPVVLEKTVVNKTLPIFNDDFLNMNLSDIPDFGIILLLDGSGNYKLIINNYSKETDICYDFFTNEELGTSEEVEEMTKNSKMRKVYKEQIDSYKVVFNITYSTIINGGFKNNTINKKRTNRVIDDFLLDVKEYPTVQGLIAAYSALPNGCTIDYSEKDFSNNPNIVQPQPDN